MKTVGQPGQQPGFGRRKVHTGDADLGESQFEGPGLYLRHELRTVDLTTVERHALIVENAAQTVVWHGEDDTRAFAAQLASRPAIGAAFIELRGDLGAGKTTLVRHLLRALGVTERIKSPTYAVVEPHEVPGLAIWHFDFFRFSDSREWEDAGFRDIFAGPGLKLAEWPENAGALLPPADLVVRIDVQDDDSRRVTLEPRTPLGQELLQ